MHVYVSLETPVNQRCIVTKSNSAICLAFIPTKAYHIVRKASSPIFYSHLYNIMFKLGSCGMSSVPADTPFPSTFKDADMRNRSILEIGTESNSFDTSCSAADGTNVNNDPSFESMHIKIQLLGLMNGIVMETSHREAHRIKNNKSKALGDVPVFAVITGFNEVPPGNYQRERTLVATHLPSIPIENVASSQGKTHNFMAVWPADFDPTGDQTSTVMFTRKMKKAPIKSLAGVQTNSTTTCMYTTESLILAISLMRGSDMITLGTVNVHFTGAETSSVQTNLPVKVTKNSVNKAVAQMKGEKIKKKWNKNKNKRKLLKPLSFKGDPSRNYRLDEDAVLSLLVETTKGEQPFMNPGCGAFFSPKDIIVESEENFAEVQRIMSLKNTLTQHDILLDLAISKEEFGGDAEDDDDSDEESNGTDIENLESKDSSDQYDINIDASAKHMLATRKSIDSSPMRILSACRSSASCRSATSRYVHAQQADASSPGRTLSTCPSATSQYVYAPKANSDFVARRHSKSDDYDFPTPQRSGSEPSSSLSWFPKANSDFVDRRHSKSDDFPTPQRSGSMPSSSLAWLTPKGIAEKFNFANFEENEVFDSK